MSHAKTSLRKIVLAATLGRNHMLLDTELDETVLQLPQTVFSDHEITRRAVDVWLKYFNPPRARPLTTQRIDAGVPKMKGVKETDTRVSMFR